MDEKEFYVLSLDLHEGTRALNIYHFQKSGEENYLFTRKEALYETGRLEQIGFSTVVIPKDEIERLKQI